MIIYIDRSAYATSRLYPTLYKTHATVLCVRADTQAEFPRGTWTYYTYACSPRNILAIPRVSNNTPPRGRRSVRLSAKTPPADLNFPPPAQSQVIALGRVLLSSSNYDLTSRARRSLARSLASDPFFRTMMSLGGAAVTQRSTAVISYQLVS